MPQAMFDKIFGKSGTVTKTLLDLMGISATFNHVIKTYNPLTDVTTNDLTVADVTISPILRFNAYEIANLHIEKDDAKILGKGSDYTEIRNGIDFFVVNNEKWVIVAHEKVYSGKDVALIKFQVRKQVGYVPPAYNSTSNMNIDYVPNNSADTGVDEDLLVVSNTFQVEDIDD